MLLHLSDINKMCGGVLLPYFGWILSSIKAVDQSIVDRFASGGDALAVVDQAADFLERRGVDIIVSNQSHVAWRSAFEDAGYMRGPSNFALAMSKSLAKRVAPYDQSTSRIHMTRGDGDGPIHL